jgi:glycosyltransferase involved in cell wall biosynthesis
MRILVNADALVPLGGVELSTLQVARGLSNSGHDVHLLFASDGHLREQWSTFARSMRQVRGFTVALANPLKTIHHLPQSVRAGTAVKPDVIYLNRAEQMLWARLVSARTGAPIVCHLRHHPHSHKVVRLMDAAVHSYLAVSEMIKREWVEVGIEPEKIAVVHNGIDVDAYPPLSTPRAAARSALGLPASGAVTLYYGRVTRDKGIGVLLEAWARSRPRDDDTLLIAGDTDQATAALIAQSRLPGVRTLPRQVDVVPLLQASDIAVLPAMWEEPFGRVIIEAMSTGVPVVASRSGGIPEILTGIFERQLVRPGDAAELSRALVEFRDWRTTNPMLGQLSRAHVRENFSLQRTVEAVEATLIKASPKSPMKRSGPPRHGEVISRETPRGPAHYSPSYTETYNPAALPKVGKIAVD